MRLRGVDYGPIWAASGALGFFGEGYWFHKLVPGLEKSLKLPTPVAKTVTLDRNVGNMYLDWETWQPTHLLPNCIKVNWRKGIVVNSVGLSNFGIQAALDHGGWFDHERPQLLSFMPLPNTALSKIEQSARFADTLLEEIDRFVEPVALQVNLSCPNTGENLRELEKEAVEILRALQVLKIALVPKFNVLTSPKTVQYISEQVEIAGVCVSNTIPYGELPDKIDWKKMFGKQSPLPKKYGSGGLSGKPLFDLVNQWVLDARAAGLRLPINAGGGIFHASQVHTLFESGADSVSIGTVIMLRPWQVGSIIRAAHNARARLNK